MWFVDLPKQRWVFPHGTALVLRLPNSSWYGWTAYRYHTSFFVWEAICLGCDDAANHWAANTRKKCLAKICRLFYYFWLCSHLLSSCVSEPKPNLSWKKVNVEKTNLVNNIFRAMLQYLLLYFDAQDSHDRCGGDHEYLGSKTDDLDPNNSLFRHQLSLFANLLRMYWTNNIGATNDNIPALIISKIC